jgi:predicted AAA+ superfamily ATPase
VTFKGIKADDVLLASEQRFRLVEYLNEYLKWGGFPEVSAARNEFDRRKIADEYLDAIFFKDLIERYEITNIPLIKSLKNKIFSTFSTKFSLIAFYNKLKGNFPFSKDLLYRYYQHLLDSKTVFEARKFSDSEYKKSRNPPKVYIIDPVLSQKVAHDDSARILENIVFVELLRRNCKPHYFFQNNECDFVVEKDRKTRVIQVTNRLEAGNRERELNGIVEAAASTRSQEGYILTFNEEDEHMIDNITIKVMPAWKWLLSG